MSRQLIAPILLLLGLAACASRGPAGDYIVGSIPLDCAPFALALSGIRLSGAALKSDPLREGVL